CRRRGRHDDFFVGKSRRNAARPEPFNVTYGPAWASRHGVSKSAFTRVHSRSPTRSRPSSTADGTSADKDALCTRLNALMRLWRLAHLITCWTRRPECES